MMYPNITIKKSDALQDAARKRHENTQVVSAYFFAEKKTNEFYPEDQLKNEFLQQTKKRTKNLKINVEMKSAIGKRHDTAFSNS